MIDDRWVESAKCRGMGDISIFFPDSRDHKSIEKVADAYCNSCAVKGECRDWALATEQHAGVWGGEHIAVLRGERRKKTYKPKTFAAHGTWQRYHQHRRMGEIACGPCIEAWRVYIANRRELRAKAS